MDKQSILINEARATVSYDPELRMLRGEFVGLNGGADFYAENLEALIKEGQTSLKVFLNMCEEEGIAPESPRSPA